jgi:hypothetical protein
MEPAFSPCSLCVPLGRGDRGYSISGSGVGAVVDGGGETFQLPASSVDLFLFSLLLFCVHLLVLFFFFFMCAYFGR